MGEDRNNVDLHTNKYSDKYSKRLESAFHSLGIDEQDDALGQANSSLAHHDVVDPIADLENSLTVLNQKKFSSLSSYAQLNAKLSTIQRENSNNATQDSSLLFSSVLDKTNQASANAIRTVNEEIDALHNMVDVDTSSPLDSYDASVGLASAKFDMRLNQLHNEYVLQSDPGEVQESLSVEPHTLVEDAAKSTNIENTSESAPEVVSSPLARLSGQQVSQQQVFDVDANADSGAANQPVEKSFIRNSVLINAYNATTPADAIDEHKEVNVMNESDEFKISSLNSSKQFSTSMDTSAGVKTPMPAPNSGAPEISRKEVHKNYNSRVVKTFIRDIAIVVVVVVTAVVLSVVIKSFVIQPFLIPSSSMSETLQIDDKILVNKFSKHFSSIKRGEVVVFRDINGWTRNHLALKKGKEPSTVLDNVLKFVGLQSEDDESYLVKRVIGIAGDHVSCKGSGEPIYINNKELPHEPYVYKGSNPSDKAFDVTVPANSFFVMGDNRSVSADSRYNTDKPGNGFVPKEDIVGTVFMRIAQMSRLGMLEDETKVFDSIPNP
jgi:signal peptidase I